VPLCRLAEYHRDHQPIEAEKLYAEVLTKSAENIEALVGLSAIYIARAEFDLAETFLMRAAANNPETSQFYRLLASLFRSRCQSLAALRALQAALELETHAEEIAALQELIKETRRQLESSDQHCSDAYKLGNTLFGLRFVDDSGENKFLIA
jgi:tetratricopeptide (TPR) repeat protein